MKKFSSFLELINTSYKQRKGASIIASYGIVMEYFSKGDYPLFLFFKNYKNYFDLVQPAGIRIEEVITKHFHNYCYTNEKMKFEFVREFHLSNLFNTRTYCRVALWKSMVFPIETEEVLELRHKLINGGLAMVIYTISHTSFHCIVVGYDKEDRRFFKRDPTKNKIIFEDFLSHRTITEYILFVGKSA
jgi:hypothetical protein